MAHELSGTFTVQVATTDEFANIPITEDAAAIELANNGANPLDAFEVWGKAHSAGAFVLLHSAAGDFTTPKGIVKDCGVAPQTLAAGAKTLIVLNGMSGIYALSLRASSGTGTTTLDWKYRGAST